MKSDTQRVQRRSKMIMQGVRSGQRRHGCQALEQQNQSEGRQQKPLAARRRHNGRAQQRGSAPQNGTVFRYSRNSNREKYNQQAGHQITKRQKDRECGLESDYADRNADQDLFAITFEIDLAPAQHALPKRRHEKAEDPGTKENGERGNQRHTLRKSAFADSASKVLNCR